MSFADSDLAAIARDLEGMHTGQLNTAVRRLLEHDPARAADVCQTFGLSDDDDRRTEQERVWDYVHYWMGDESRRSWLGVLPVGHDEGRYACEVVRVALMLLGTALRLERKGAASLAAVQAQVGRPRPGWLWAAVQALLAHAPDLSEGVCRAWNLAPDAPYPDDVAILTAAVEYKPRKRSERLVQGALMLLGLHARQPRGAAPAASSPVPVTVERPASVALVLRASRLSGQALGQELPAGDAVDLVGDAIYFRCSRAAEAEAMEQRLALHDDLPPAGSEQYVYLRLAVPNGDGLVSRSGKFGLEQGLGELGDRPVRLAALKRIDLKASASELQDFAMS